MTSKTITQLYEEFYEEGFKDTISQVEEHYDKQEMEVLFDYISTNITVTGVSIGDIDRIAITHILLGFILGWKARKEIHEANR